MESNVLDTICAVISSEFPNNVGYKVLFINTSYYTGSGTNKNQISMRCIDLNTGTEISDNGLGCSCVMEYYMFHFIKNYKENKFIEINLKDNYKTNVLFNSGTLYLYDKKNWSCFLFKLFLFY